MTARAATLSDVAVPAIGDGQAARWIRAAILVAAGAGLTALSAQVVWFAPWNPTVPYTFQTASALLVGTALGSRLGLASMLLYVGLGAVGLGVFANGSSGLATDGQLSATLGYLGGFVLAAALVGWLAERGWDRSPATTIGLMVIGNLVIYAIGVPVLIAIAGLSITDGIRYGALDFVPWDLIKIAGAAAILPLAWRAVGARGKRP
jgi:biotin transport system substrate-specific component